MWLRHVSFLRRLQGLAAFNLLSVFLCVAAGFFCASQLTRISEDVGLSKDAVADILPPPMYLIEMRLVLSQLVEGSLSAVQGQAEIARLAKEYGERVAFWQQQPNVPEPVRAAMLGAQHQRALAFIAKARQVAEMAGRMGSEDLRLEVPELNALYLSQRQEVDKTVKVAAALAERRTQDFTAVVARSQWGLALVFGVTALLSVVLFGVTIRSILGPLQQSVASVHRMADGDLCEDIRPQGRDEMTTLSSALLQLQRSLTRTVQAVQHNAEVVAATSRHIAHGNRDLSDRTQRQAAALEQTAATMGQLSEAMGHNAEQSREASVLAGGASEAASHSGSVMGQVVDSIRGIQSSSRQIGDIIGVIDSIAFQTNILALNAAVEAARAGEQGRGFAVVAAEVRSLAQRSAEAAREIKGLITSSGEQVERGTRLVDEAGRAMSDTVSAIQHVADIVRGITTSSVQQTEGVGQVGQAVSQMDHATQQNAALVQEGASTAAQLSVQAESLLEAIAAFRLSAAPRA
ncbi:MAG: HAMP domain-containing protein [Proteobacteria bacterium]|uniref:methyl-accepting chemotaxis protein n=1 Tax=Aquabacterium sp. TaxID=1872578 RepID=UPI0035C67A3E|nr:HAMP domain-containing protein [Pseudomonadota bacterium]